MALLLTACAVGETPSKNDWLANAPKISQDSSGSTTPSELPDVGGNPHSHSGHSGHR